MDRRERERSPAGRLCALTLAFLSGLVLGQVLASGMPTSASAELRQYLSGRLFRKEAWKTGGSHVFTTISLFLRYPLLALLLGAAPAGGALLCGAAVVFGFSLSFSVGCFAKAFGRGGVALAAAAMGIRCLTTVPCFFLLAISERTVSVRSPLGGARSTGRGKPLWLLSAVCGTALFLGICVDLILTPRLLLLAAERVLI